MAAPGIEVWGCSLPLHFPPLLPFHFPSLPVPPCLVTPIPLSPFPLPHPSFSFLSLTSFPPLPLPSHLSPLPFPIPPLPPPCREAVTILNPAVSSPAGSGAEPQPKLNLVHFGLKIWHPVAIILIIFLRINDQISCSLNSKGKHSPWQKAPTTVV